MNLYYKIWVDCILKAQSQPQNKDNWKLFTMIFMSMTMAINLWFITFVLMEHFKYSIPFFPLKIGVFQGTRIGSFVNFFVSYLLPFLVLNYFLIFYKRKYEKLIEVFPYRKGKLFIAYFFGSLAIVLLYFLIAFLILKVL